MSHRAKILSCVGITIIVLGSWSTSWAQGNKAATAQTAKELASNDLTNLKPSTDTVKDLTPLSAPSQEGPGSPKYVHIDKVHAAVQPRVPVGDNGTLLRADLNAPGKIIRVDWYCIGGTCGWSHGCEAAACGAGHPWPVEYHNDNTATWYAWTNDGNNSEYVFVVHYERP